MTIIVHRSEDVIFSARTKKCCSCIFLSSYISIYLCINIYLSVYLYHKNVISWYLDMPWIPMHALSTNCDDTNPLPWPPYTTYIYLYIHLCICIYFFSFIYLSIYISIWKLTIYLPYSFINAYISIFICIYK